MQGCCCFFTLIVFQVNYNPMNRKKCIQSSLVVNPIRFLISCVPTVPVWKKPPQIYRKLFHVTTRAVAKHVVHLSWEYHVYQSVSLSQISELLLISSWCRHHGSLAWNLWVHVNIQVYLESVYTVKNLLLKVSWIFLKNIVSGLESRVWHLCEISAFLPQIPAHITLLTSRGIFLLVGYMQPIRLEGLSGFMRCLHRIISYCLCPGNRISSRSLEALGIPHLSIPASDKKLKLCFVANPYHGPGWFGAESIWMQSFGLICNRDTRWFQQEEQLPNGKCQGEEVHSL